MNIIEHVFEKNRKLSRYKKINYLFLGFFVLNLVFSIINAKLSGFNFIRPTLIYFLIFPTVFLIFNFVGEKKYTKYSQVLFLYIIALFLITFNTVFDVSGFILGIFVYFLSRKYGLFKHQKLYSFIVFFVFITALIISWKLHPVFNNNLATLNITIFHILNIINFYIVSVHLIIFVFEEDIEKLKKQNSILTDEVVKSRLFSNLGENIAGLIHNMKNDISILEMSTQILEEEVGKEKLIYFRRGVKRLQDKILNILTIAKYSEKDEDIDINLNLLVKSVLGVFELSKKYKKVKIEYFGKDQLWVHANPMEVSQIFENIIKNSYEALEEKWNKENFLPSLGVFYKLENNFCIVKIVDNAQGIEGCLEYKDCGENCQNCDVFKIGRTTKASGSGMGMNYVIKTVHKLNGDVKIETSRQGTKISVYLPYEKKGGTDDEKNLFDR